MAVFDYPTVTIETEDFTSYADLETADLYLSASMSEAAVAWRALADNADDKGRYLVQMTRILDRQNWQGEKADADNDHAFPRSGIIINGVEVDAATLPQAIIDACIEGAALLAAGADFESRQNQSQQASSLRAGSVAITFFRGADGTPMRFPQILMELLRPYLSGSTSSSGPQAYGTDGCSVTRNVYGYTRGL